MKTLKSIIESDSDLFINVNEFGEAHQVNGEVKNILIDKEQLKERSSKNHNPDGLYTSDVLFYAKKSDFQAKPVIGENLELDEEWFVVNDVGEESGLYVIELVANRT